MYLFCMGGSHKITYVCIDWRVVNQFDYRIPVYIDIKSGAIQFDYVGRIKCVTPSLQYANCIINIIAPQMTISAIATSVAFVYIPTLYIDMDGIGGDDKNAVLAFANTGRNHPVPFDTFVQCIFGSSSTFTDMINMGSDNEKCVVVTDNLLRWLGTSTNDFANIIGSYVHVKMDSDEYKSFVEESDSPDGATIIDRRPAPVAGKTYVMITVGELKKIMLRMPVGNIMADYYVELERVTKMYMAYQSLDFDSSGCSCVLL
jgi:hypothetical protein